MSNWSQKKKKPSLKGNGGGDAYNAMKSGGPNLGSIASDIDSLLKESEEKDREEEEALARDREDRNRGRGGSCWCG